MTDALGSVRAQADDTATVTGTSDWDVWGNATAGGAGLFGWDGEQRDPETGLSFLRARYYSPVYGQFLARDPLGAGSGTRRSAYAFANGNPATLGDPRGLTEVTLPWLAGWLGQRPGIADVFECFLYGECRNGRRHAVGTAEGGIERGNPTIVPAGVPQWNPDAPSSAQDGYPQPPTTPHPGCCRYLDRDR